MSSCFPLVSFDDKRNPTIGKVLRDAHQMVSMSKYVIILNERGEIVSSPTPFDAKKVDPVLECMVIVAPVLYEGVLIPNAVVLEIGFNRFVPYAQTEYKDERQIVRAIKQRARVAGISATVLLGIMPTVLGLVQQEVDERMSRWKKSHYVQTRGNTAHPNQVPELVFVKIPLTCTLLVYGALLYDFKWRVSEGGNIYSRASQFREWLDEFIQANEKSLAEDGEYLDDCIRQSRRIFEFSQALKMFQQRNRNSHMRISALEDLIDGDIGSRRRKLLAQVRRVFKLANPVTDAYFQSLDETHQQHKAHLEASWTIHSVSLLKRDRRRLKHAQNCLVVGVAASQGLRERKVLSYYQSEDDDEMQVHF